MTQTHERELAVAEAQAVYDAKRAELVAVTYADAETVGHAFGALVSAGLDLAWAMAVEEEAA